MIVKVCGMREPDNIRAVAQAGADWLGLIFYGRSPRAVAPGDASLYGPVVANGQKIRKVGVFVNAGPEEMVETARVYGLDCLQLHGEEPPELCDALQRRGLAVIKAFSVAAPEDLAATASYCGCADYLLFDTKCDGYGGSGRTFDWSILHAYRGRIPFLLSGGLTPGSLEAVKAFRHPLLAGVDLNSGFETAPGVKDAGVLTEFIKNIKFQ